ncbi:phytanoyl-CoA dioxygenase [Aspergillus crustosus]
MSITTTTTTTTTETIANGKPLKYKLAPEIGQNLQNDLLAEISRDGYTVIKNVIPADRAARHQQNAFSWLKSFNNANLNISDPTTWTAENLPVHSPINTFSKYAVNHERFIWDIRLEPGVLEVFEKIWGTDELLVSFDALNVTFPNRRDVKPREPWEHVDQSPVRRGLHCVQGIVNLSKSGPDDGGLVVYPGSHKLIEAFFETQTEKNTWIEQDNYRLTQDQLSWFTDKGIKPLKVCAEPGDLIIWDSRLIHYGSEPTSKSNMIRTVLYAAYAPARFATEEQLALKKAVFERFEGTTHWPHDNIRPRPNEAYLADGSLDPKNRDRPLTEPEYTDKLLKLAGAKRY